MRLLIVAVLWILAVPAAGVDHPQARATSEKAAPDNFRRPKDEAELRQWLENMVWHHRFTGAEMTAATGLSAEEITAATKKFDLRQQTRPKRKPGDPLLVLPYPGGRHPRIGFLDGAIRPHRETKVSVFAPWDAASYVVVDVPEAIWWNRGGGRELLYLAHTHIPTTWDKQGVKLKPLEWSRGDGGSLSVERTLPNQVAFGTRVTPGKDGVRMEMWLTNGSQEKLGGLRVQNCVMLKGAAEFRAQTNDNKVTKAPYVACRNAQGDRWVITAWKPNQRTWSNPPCPCMHSDPQFPDCPPGKTVRLRGWLSFYEGRDVQGEFARLDRMGWQAKQQPSEP